MADSDAVDEFATTYKSFMDAMLAAARGKDGAIRRRVLAHLGAEPSQLPVVAEELEPFEHPNLQVALDAYLSVPGRDAELIGVASEAGGRRFMALGLTDFLGTRAAFEEGPADWVNQHLDGGRVLACVQFGLYLIRSDGASVVALVSGPTQFMGPAAKVTLQVIAAPSEAAQAFIAEIRARMSELSVYRGKVISVSPGQMGAGLQVEFHDLPAVQRSDVVLPTGLLERIERQTIVFSEHAEELLAQGRSLKRGILLFGLPGTGKTLTIMYLAGAMKGRAVLLATGRGIGMVQSVFRMARVLAPSMVVMEDVDLVAEMRGMPTQPTGPLLFELLNEMDGLRPEADVVFVLTTNRPDILEPALAARPGRIDLVAELPLPDAEARGRLIELYARGLRMGGFDAAALVERTDGVSPAYIKEMLRRAALLAAEAVEAQVSESHLAAAMEELNEGGKLAQRILGFRPQPAPAEPAAFMAPPGFPTTMAKLDRS